MTVQAVDESQTREPTWGSRAGLLGWALLICWATLVATVVFVGERPSSLAQLERDVAAGEVRVVRVEGGLAPRGRGYSVVELHWRKGVFGYSTQVIEARPRRAAPRRPGEGVTAVIDQSVGARLSAADPHVRVTRARRYSGISADFFGWQLAGWMAWLAFATSLACLLTLVAGPRPLRATRWAWFWLILQVPPVGVTAFLLLGGPTSLLPGPRVGGKRLTGGWAFLLGLVLAALLPTDR